MDDDDSVVMFGELFLCFFLWSFVGKGKGLGLCGDFLLDVSCDFCFQNNPGVFGLGPIFHDMR